MKKRNYSGSDANMAETARTTHGLFVNDLSSFTAFDADLNQTYADDFETSISAAETVVRDTAIIDQQAQLTVTVENALQRGNDIYQDVKYFIEKKAFKNNLEVQNEFGKNDYRAVRKSQKKMILFLDEMWKACDKYKTQLIAAKFSQTNIDEILVVRDVLRNNNTNQELFKKGRPVLTNDRIEVLNTCFDNMELILEAAQRVFRNNEVKRKQYVFNPNSNTDQVLSNIEGPIAANAVRNLGLLPTGAKTFRFKNNGPTALQIGLSIDGLIFEGNTVTSGGVGSDDIDIADLNSTGNIVIVQNQSTTQVGNFKLEILG